MERGATQDFFMLALVILAAAGVLLAVNLGPTGKGGFLGIDDAGIQPTGDEHTQEPTGGDTSAGISDTADIFGTGTRVGYFEVCCIIGCKQCYDKKIAGAGIGRGIDEAKGYCYASLDHNCKKEGGTLTSGPVFDPSCGAPSGAGQGMNSCDCTGTCYICKNTVTGGEGAGTTYEEALAACKANAQEICTEVGGTPIADQFVEVDCGE